MQESLTPEEVDQLLKLPEGKAARLARRGKLPHIALPDGKTIRFRRAEIEKLLQNDKPVSPETPQSRKGTDMPIASEKATDVLTAVDSEIEHVRSDKLRERELRDLADRLAAAAEKLERTEVEARKLAKLEGCPFESTGAAEEARRAADSAKLDVPSQGLIKGRAHTSVSNVARMVQQLITDCNGDLQSRTDLAVVLLRAVLTDLRDLHGDSQLRSGLLHQSGPLASALQPPEGPASLFDRTKDAMHFLEHPGVPNPEEWLVQMRTRIQAVAEWRPVAAKKAKA